MSTREFEFKDGASDKFWSITLEGDAFVVNFGRRGTTGQTQTKKWASPDEARRNYEKLIAEKTKKGYVEKTASSSGAAPRPEPRTPLPDPLPAARGEGTGSDLPLPLAGEGRGEGKPLTGDVRSERHVDLTRAEWAMATWRKPPETKPTGPAAAFDRDACAAKLGRLRILQGPHFNRDGWRPDWSGLELPAVMSREEAHYWFLAMTSLKKNADPADLAAALAKKKLGGRVSEEDVSAALQYGKNPAITEEIVPVLRSLFSEGELGKLLLGEERSEDDKLPWSLILGYDWTVASLPRADAEKLRAQIRPMITPASWPDRFKSAYAFRVAALLGMHDELRPVVDSWPDDLYREEWSDLARQPQLVICGLGDPELVQRHMRRLRLRLRNARQVAGWLAHTEWRALDLVTDSILGCRNKDDCETLLAALGAVKAPEAAGPMLRLTMESKAPRPARAWLDENVGHAIVGLTGVAASRSALADAAVEQLRDWKRKGLGPQIADAVKALPAEQQKRLQAEVVDRPEVVFAPFDEKTTPAWLATGVADAATRPAPTWIAPGSLPALAVDGRRLSDPQVVATLAALQASTFDEPHPLVAGLRKHADPASADAFAWKLFESWMGAGASSKEKWAMAALGALGGDASVLKLTPMVRAWPGENQHPRAVLGLQVLRAIGSDTALMQLNGIAQKLKFQGLKTRAREFMEAIAKDKGLTRAELEDRVVPDFDLDERGRRVFDYGARRFTFMLGPDLKPMVRDDDEKAKLRDNLPDPGPKDDAGKAAEAIAAWKAIKKQIKEVAQVQAGRLEQAMVTGRRWKTADFQTLVVRQPLMINLARLLLWGAYDGQTLRETFRVNEDQECVQVDDEPFTLGADAAIGLVHPLQLDDGAREAWGQRFADYGIIPPFPQLGRAVHRLESGEDKKSSLERAVKLPAPTLVFGLEQLGWVRGAGMDNGEFDEHSRQFPDAAITAVVNYEGGVSYGYIQPDDMLTITGCCFVSGLRAPSGFGHGLDQKIKLGDVDPIVISETLHDLAMLASKAKS
jgi:predicted DNA-binding WGR domain protein